MNENKDEDGNVTSKKCSLCGFATLAGPKKVIKFTCNVNNEINFFQYFFCIITESFHPVPGPQKQDQWEHLQIPGGGLNIPLLSQEVD